MSSTRHSRATLHFLRRSAVYRIRKPFATSFGTLRKNQVHPVISQFLLWLRAVPSASVQFRRRDLPHAYSRCPQTRPRRVLILAYPRVERVQIDPQALWRCLTPNFSRQLYRFLPSFVAVSICHPHPPSFSLILSLYLAFENSTFIVALHWAFKYTKWWRRDKWRKNKEKYKEYQEAYNTSQIT